MESVVEQLARIGKRRTRARKVLDETTPELLRLVREAHAAGVPKRTIAKNAGISRPTLDDWLRKP